MKKTQIDRAVEDLEAKLEALRVGWTAEAKAMEAAIASLKAQRRRPRPRAVGAAVKEERPA